jgi:subtilisin-like proprotein convertase family protein
MSKIRDKGLSLWSLAFVAIIVFGLGSISYGATFTNSSPITIPAIGNGSPYPSAISVSGLSGTVTNVDVTFNSFHHTFPDDVAIVLVGPTGAALLLQDGNGDDVVPTVTYTLSDSGSTLLPDEDPWGPGTYKPAAYFTGDSFPAPGPLLVYNHPGPAGGNTATFASTFNGTAPNGTWNLFIRDFVNGDDGGLDGGWTINITTSAPGNTQHYIDMNGDGKTDYSVVRNTGGGPGGQITWFTQYAGTTTAQYDAWGIASDFFVPGNYDADNKTDVAVWRPASQGYYILQSQTGTLRAEFFGLSGDDPRVVGDYDGDGKDDIAVYRAGASSGQPSFWYWRTTLAGPVFAAQWGQNGDFPAPGDYDGDGKNDFVVQRNAGGGQARFWRLFATGSSDSLVFGTPTDVIVPGDYDADGKTDIATIRGSGGQILWWIHPSGGGADTAQFWGNSATDFPTQGDYDGDGKTDISIWRPNADPTQNFYFVLGSTSGFFSQEWGQNGDYPVANYNAH